MNLNKVSGIYKITNKLNNNFYIGSSIQIGIRFQQHKIRLRKNEHHSHHFQRAWNLYGEENFVFEIIERCDPSVTIEREQFYLDTLKPVYNTQLIAAMPPQDPERSRQTMKRLWSSGKFDDQLKPFERIDPNTGEAKEYRTASEAEGEGFSQQSISACCTGRKSSYANFYWRFLDGSTPKAKTAYEKVFRKVVGTHKITGEKINIDSFEQCNEIGFNYGKIRACCAGKRGRRTHNDYAWIYADEHNQQVAQQSRVRTFSETFKKSVIRTTPLTGEVKIYESGTDAEIDGFRQQSISRCCTGKRDTYKGFLWRFA